MTNVIRQLNAWRFRERLVRLAWGGARWLAIVGTVLGFACLLDWAVDRYSGSAAWRGFLASSWVFAAPDPLAVGETPFWFRVFMTFGQLALAAGLAYYLLVRPWVRTPPIDDLATRAEKAFPAFDHRLVTALQLNRPAARTLGMSKALIAEVTREAGELASRYDFLRLVDYRRLRWAAVAVAPVLLGWGVFVGVNPALAGVLLKRQALLDVEIPRNVRLENVTRPVWPTGSEVVIRFKVAGVFDENAVGTVRITADDEPETYRELRYEGPTPDGAAFFTAALPPSSRDFRFLARLGAGRTREPGAVRFEAPPQIDERAGLTAEQVLPAYLGRRPDGTPFVRRTDGWLRGDVIGAVPRAEIQVVANFTKPVAQARLVRVEQDGPREKDADLPPLAPVEVAPDRTAAAWRFPAAKKLSGYRLELVDDLGFVNPTLIRRNVRMIEDRPPVVEFRTESNRNPDPAAPDGKGNPKDYEWNVGVVGPNGRVQVIWAARSDLGIRDAALAYRVIPRGVAPDAYPETVRDIHHPRDDRGRLLYKWEHLKPFPRDPEKMGRFVPELGLFEKSGKYGQVEYYPLPAADPRAEPGGLVAGGCKNFEVSDLKKLVPDGTGKLIEKPVEVGDTIEMYVEARDRLSHLTLTARRRGMIPLPVVADIDLPTILALPTRDDDGTLDHTRLPPRPPGYTREAKRKIVVTDEEAQEALARRDEERQKRAEQLSKIAQDQATVARQNQPNPDPPKKK